MNETLLKSQKINLNYLINSKRQIISKETNDQIKGLKKVIDSDEDIIEKLKTIFQIVFTIEGLEVLLLPDREEGDTLESIELNSLEVSRLMKELDQSKAQGPVGISTFVLRENAGTLNNPLLIMFNTLRHGCLKIRPKNLRLCTRDVYCTHVFKNLPEIDS